jgi:hypothetical protein
LRHHRRVVTRHASSRLHPRSRRRHAGRRGCRREEAPRTGAGVRTRVLIKRWSSTDDISNPTRYDALAAHAQRLHPHVVAASVMAGGCVSDALQPVSPASRTRAHPKRGGTGQILVKYWSKTRAHPAGSDGGGADESPRGGPARTQRWLHAYNGCKGRSHASTVSTTITPQAARRAASRRLYRRYSHQRVVTDLVINESSLI